MRLPLEGSSPVLFTPSPLPLLGFANSLLMYLTPNNNNKVGIRMSRTDCQGEAVENAEGKDLRPGLGGSPQKDRR